MPSIGLEKNAQVTLFKFQFDLTLSACLTRHFLGAIVSKLNYRLTMHRKNEDFQFRKASLSQCKAIERPENSAAASLLIYTPDAKTARERPPLSSVFLSFSLSLSLSLGRPRRTKRQREKGLARAKRERSKRKKGPRARESSSAALSPRGPYPRERRNLEENGGPWTVSLSPLREMTPISLESPREPRMCVISGSRSPAAAAACVCVFAGWSMCVCEGEQSGSTALRFLPPRVRERKRARPSVVSRGPCVCPARLPLDYKSERSVYYLRWPGLHAPEGFLMWSYREVNERLGKCTFSAIF